MSDYNHVSGRIYQAYRQEVLDHEETRKRMLTQIRHLLVESNQLKKELEESREREEVMMKFIQSYSTI